MYKNAQISLMQVCEVADGRKMASPEEIADELKDLQTAAQEQFIVLTFNTKHRLIQRHMVSLGTLNSALVHVREVFRPAFMDAAAHIVVAHNHPSGDPAPSAQDIKITNKLIEAGKLLEIGVLDHVIIGRPLEGRTDFFLSLRESGMVTFY